MSPFSFSWIFLNFSLLLPFNILKTVVFVETLTDRSFVRSPSTTSRSFYRWTRRYWADSLPHSLKMLSLKKKLLCAHFFVRLVSGVLGVGSESRQRVPHGLHEGRTAAWAHAATRRGETPRRRTKSEMHFERFLLPLSLMMLLYVSSSWRSCSLKRTLCVTLESRLLLLTTWRGRCLSTGSPPHTTRRLQQLCLKYSSVDNRPFRFKSNLKWDGWYLRF